MIWPRGHDFISYILAYLVVDQVMKVSAIDCIKGFNSSSCVLLPREQLQKLYMLLVYSPNHMKAFSKLHLFISIVIDAAPYEPKPSAAGTKPRIGSEDRDNAILSLMQTCLLKDWVLNGSVLHHLCSQC